ncbi:MAG TPA: HAMP domain-containing sensor histidine kinase [Thermoanaerobaculia bacterium]|nr:HAMP domain-containing sensor histidine kinase [Thermoanaerobaculia bacterium]
MTDSIESTRDDFALLWQALTDLADSVSRKGFDRGALLGTTAHEVRGITCHLLDDHRVLVIAGDKLGSWYAGTFDPRTGEPADLSWRELPSLYSREPRFVVDLLRIVEWMGEPAVVVGTRGDGARIAPLSCVSRPGWTGEGLTVLPGGEGKAIRRLLLDPVSRTLWAAGGTHLLAWALDEDRPRLIQQEDLGFRVTALAIDQDEDDPARDQLYVATNRCGLHRFGRTAEGGFKVTAAALDLETIFWRGRTSVIEWLEPLSAIRRLDGSTGKWGRRYRDRGVFGATLRHLVLVCDDLGGGSSAVAQTRIATLQSKILDLESFCLPSWQCLAVATLEGKVRLFRPSGLRRPDHDEHAPYPEGVAEIDSPAALFSGFEDLDFPERVYGFALPAPHAFMGDQRLPVVLGLGNHSVRLHQLTSRWELRRQAREAARRLTGSLPVNDLLDRLQEIALSPDRLRREKIGLIHVVPELGALCGTAAQWRRFGLLIWDVLANLEDRSVPILMIQALRQLQDLPPQRREHLEETITAIRKYVLDRDSFSEKETDFLKLVHATDPSLADDRMIYRSILCSRRHDPVFTRNFGPDDQFGEVQAFAAVPQRGEDGSFLPFDSVAPERMRFLAGTYRRTLWLLDGTGRARRLAGMAEDWGYVQAIHFRRGEAILSFSEGGMQRVQLADLSAPWEEGGAEKPVRFRRIPGLGSAECPLAFAAVPGEGNGQFLWGDAEGRIFVADSAGSSLWADLGSDARERGGPMPAIQDLSSFVASALDGPDVALIVACTTLGTVHVRRWTSASDPASKDLATASIGNAPATSLLVAGTASLRQIVVGGMDGLVAGYWVLLDVDTAGDLSARLALYWAYRAGQAVRAVEALHTAEESGAPEVPLLVVGSYDEHLHVLDLLGRHLEIVYLPGTQVERFVTSGRIDGDSDLTEARVYACAFENQFRGLRVVSRRRILKEMERELGSLAAEEREHRLTRWRTFSLREGHLRHRFARQSERYPGPGAQDAIREIRRLLEVGDSSDRPTGLVTALLRRLFQNNLPGLPATGGGDRPHGLREILESQDLYLEILELLRQLEDQWDTPGSLENRRVQLFWIRSFLRNVDSLDLLRRWIDLGKRLAPEEPLASPGDLLLHFLDHLPELLQLKTLQYVERLLFGWRGVSHRGLLLRGDKIVQGDLEWLLEPLIHWLRTYRSLVDQTQPNPVTLQVGRLFGFLIQVELLDPLDLSRRLQEAEVPGAMDEILIDQCAALGRLPHDAREVPNGEIGVRMQRAAEALRRARDLEEQLEKKREISTIVATMEKILSHTGRSQNDGPSPTFLADVDCYYRAMIPPLQVRDLEGMQKLRTSWKPPKRACPSFPSLELLVELSRMLDAVGHYWDQKYADIYLDPMQRLTYEGFHAVRKSWRLLKAAFEQRSAKFSVQERGLFSRLVEQWKLILAEEQNKHVLQDFLGIVEGHLQEVPKASSNAVEAMTRVTEEEKLTFTAFSSLFTRLLLFSEPSRALFIYRGLATRTVGTRIFVQEDDPDDYRLFENDFPGQKPFSLPSSWMRWETFEQLERDKVERWLRESEPGLTWEVVPIPIVAEAVTHFGFYAFGWTEKTREGWERFKLHRLTWVVVLQALAFRQASVNQDAMKSRIFSIVAHNLRAPVFKMRSDLGVLIQGWLEEQSEPRQEKYRELRRQARHMTGIIDGILSLSDRETSVEMSEVALANVVYDVVRTVRKDAQAKGIRLGFPKPDSDAVQASLFWTDEVKVYDILLNLIGNAIKYSSPGSSVHVDLQVKPRGADIRVRDEGPGISRSELPFIFEPFFRGRHPAVESVEGMGLGLYVSQLYAEKLRGRIQASNNAEGRGVTFTIFLPHQTRPEPGAGEKP